MSTITHESARELRKNAPVFAALGDPTRLAIVSKLSDGSRCSISRLTEGSPITRQAITKHLHILQNAGLIRGLRQGRENLFELNPEPLNRARRLDRISHQWDDALTRLRQFVEK